jgi:hypothetical protein
VPRKPKTSRVFMSPADALTTVAMLVLAAGMLALAWPH